MDFWVFRGHADSSWRLETTMDRFNFSNKYWAETRMLYDLSKNYKTFNLKEIDFNDDVQKIALLQHHGAPTRFLDVTHSPYVAAYFAFENINHNSEFCSIYGFNYLALIMQTGKLLDGQKDYVGSNLIKNSDSLSDPKIFKKLVLNPDQKDFVGIINPKHLFSRLRNQTGSFLCQGNVNKDFESNLTEINNTIYPEPIFRKYILPTSLRLEVLSDLRKMNITRYTLFQDFDGFSKSLPIECEIQSFREDKYYNNQDNG